MINSQVSITLNSSKSSVSQIEPILEQLKTQLQIDDNKYYNILIAITEAVNNAVIHGNKNDPNKKVEFKINFFEGNLEFFIQDEGKGFDPENIADPRDENNLRKEGGRGVFLIKSLSNNALYEKNSRGMLLNLKFKL